jgi:hypothetical protein
MKVQSKLLYRDWQLADAFPTGGEDRVDVRNASTGKSTST